jgi:hypothetical protein
MKGSGIVRRGFCAAVHSCLRGWLAAMVFFCPAILGAANVYVEPSERLIRETVDLKAGEYFEYHFPLTQGTTLVSEFRIPGGLGDRVRIRMVDPQNFKRFAAGERFESFKPSPDGAREVARYTFKVPRTGTYHLVLDNGASQTSIRALHVYAYALLPAPTPDTVRARELFEQMYRGLKTIFVFRDFGLTVRHCGTVNAFSDPDITICTELVESMKERNVLEALSFVLFHELGHTLLRLWDFPLVENEDVMDEFATVYLLLLGQRSAIEKAATYWASESSEREALAKLGVDDRHTLSVQRARNVLNWLKRGDELLRKWQKIFVPNMQTAALESLQREPFPWIDHALIRAELARRRSPRP